MNSSIGWQSLISKAILQEEGECWCITCNCVHTYRKHWKVQKHQSSHCLIHSLPQLLSQPAQVLVCVCVVEREREREREREGREDQDKVFISFPFNLRPQLMSDSWTDRVAHPIADAQSRYCKTCVHTGTWSINKSRPNQVNKPLARRSKSSVMRGGGGTVLYY